MPASPAAPVFPLVDPTAFALGPFNVDAPYGCAPWAPGLLFLYLVATSNRYWPKCSASVIAASFPLGSISPCKRSQTERTSPVLSLAEVPPTVAEFLETYKNVRWAFSLIFLTIWMTTKQVMIFVSDAISLLSFSHLPNNISPVRPSEMLQLFAVTKGGARSTKSLWTNIFFLRNLFLRFTKITQNDKIITLGVLGFWSFVLVNLKEKEFSQILWKLSALTTTYFHKFCRAFFVYLLGTGLG